jgi:hypothetical protein
MYSTKNGGKQAREYRAMGTKDSWTPEDNVKIHDRLHERFRNSQLNIMLTSSYEANNDNMMMMMI